MDARTRSSISLVRIIRGQPLRVCRGANAAMARPRSPASRSAKGSEKSASGRADSQARYTATQRAVSETLETSGSDICLLQPYDAIILSCLLDLSHFRQQT